MHDDTHKRLGIILRAASVFALCFVLWFVLYRLGLAQATTKPWIDAHVRGQGTVGVIVYIATVSVLTGVGVPRQLCSTLGGYVFGLWWGTLWATIGTAIACCLCFSYARFLGREYIQHRFAKRIAAFDAFVCQSPFLLVLLVRIVPLGSNFLTNIIAGVSSIPALAFIGASTLGFFAQNFIFALLGSSVQKTSHYATIGSIVLYIISLGLGYIVYLQYRQSQQRDQ